MAGLPPEASDPVFRSREPIAKNQEKMSMKRVSVFAAGVGLLMGSVVASPAQDAAHKGRVMIPESAIERPEDIGLRAHTPYQIFVPGDRVRLGADPNSIALPPPA